MEQYSQEWYKARLYKYTSSSIHKLMTEPKAKVDKDAGKLSQTAISYIIEKITEELDGYIPDLVNDATAWGTEQEELAKKWYSRKTGISISNVGFCQYSEVYGGSPDAMAICPDNGEGAIEIKCPYNSTNHVKHCLITSAEYFKENHTNYYWQCMSHMLTLKVQWCDFISFDPRINSELGLFIFRLHRNEEDINLLLSKIEKAEAYKKVLKEQLGVSGDK